MGTLGCVQHPATSPMFSDGKTTSYSLWTRPCHPFCNSLTNFSASGLKEKANFKLFAERYSVWLDLTGREERRESSQTYPQTESLDAGFWLASIKEKCWNLNPVFDYASIDFISSHFMFIKGEGNCLLIKWAAVNWLQWDAPNRKKSFHCLVCHVQ